MHLDEHCSEKLERTIYFGNKIKISTSLPGLPEVH
jgi:hypothetical protein